MRCPNRSDKHTARIVATNTLPGDLIPRGTKSPGDLVPRGIKLLGVPNRRDTGSGQLAPTLLLGVIKLPVVPLVWRSRLLIRKETVGYARLGSPDIQPSFLNDKSVKLSTRTRGPRTSCAPTEPHIDNCIPFLQSCAHYIVNAILPELLYKVCFCCVP